MFDLSSSRLVGDAIAAVSSIGVSATVSHEAASVVSTPEGVALMVALFALVKAGFEFAAACIARKKAGK